MEDKLYPIVKKAKTSLGRRLKEGDIGMTLIYCPVCHKRLSLKKLHPAKANWAPEYEKNKERNGNGFAGKPTHCEKCGSLIHPLS